jgi:hypothetical protein
MSNSNRRDVCIMRWLRRLIQCLDFTRHQRIRWIRSSCQLVFFACVILSPRPTPGEDTSGRLKIGNVTNDLSSNGGCALQLARQYFKKEGEFVFVSDFESRGLVNVNGTDIPVTLVRPRDVDPRPKSTIGERSTLWYSGGGIEVRVDYLTTGGCPQGTQSCAVTNYDAILTITRGKTSKSVAAKAVCGALSH